MRTIQVEIIVPDDYDDVCDEIALDDFIENPSSWDIALISKDKE